MEAAKSARHGPAYRFAVAGRIGLAAAGGYGVAALLTALLSLTLPLVRSEAVASATLLSFAVMVAIAVYVFAARTLVRAAVTVGALAVILGALLWWVGGFSGAVVAA